MIWRNGDIVKLKIPEKHPTGDNLSRYWFAEYRRMMNNQVVEIEEGTRIWNSEFSITVNTIYGKNSVYNNVGVSPSWIKKATKKEIQIFKERQIIKEL